MSPRLRAARLLCELAGAALLALLVLEGASQLWLFARPKAPAPTPEQAEERGRDPQFRFVDYALWRQRPFRGKFVNIDEAGLRATDNHPRGARPARVALYGGSTAWGVGVEDGQTIASFLSRKLAARGLDVVVENHGEWGYLSAQEAVSLLQSLEAAGPAPDAVVFLDGVNDLSQLMTSPDKPGQTLLSFALALNGIDLFDARTGLGGFKYSWRRTGLFKVLEERVRDWKLHGGPPLPEARVPELARLLAARYAANARAVRGLAAAEGFKPFFYWQPLLMTKKRPTPKESSDLAADPSMTRNLPFVRRADAEVAAALAKTPGFHDVSALFDDEPGRMYLDGIHYTGEGNEKLAERIAADLAPWLKSR